MSPNLEMLANSFFTLSDKPTVMVSPLASVLISSVAPFTFRVFSFKFKDNLVALLSSSSADSVPLSSIVVSPAKDNVVLVPKSVFKASNLPAIESFVTTLSVIFFSIAAIFSSAAAIFSPCAVTFVSMPSTLVVNPARSSFALLAVPSTVSTLVLRSPKPFLFSSTPAFSLVISPSAAVTLPATSSNFALEATPLIVTFSSAISVFSPFAFFNVTLPSLSTSYSPFTTCNSADLSSLPSFKSLTPVLAAAFASSTAFLRAAAFSAFSVFKRSFNSVSSTLLPKAATILSSAALSTLPDNTSFKSLIAFKSAFLAISSLKVSLLTFVANSALTSPILVSKSSLLAFLSTSVFKCSKAVLLAIPVIVTASSVLTVPVPSTLSNVTVPSLFTS